MTVDEAVAWTRSELASGPTPAPVAKKAAAELYRQAKHWPLVQRNRLAESLWKAGPPASDVAIYFYKRFEKQCASCEFHLFEKWLDRYVNEWGACDGLAHYLLAAAIGNQPELGELVRPWTSSANRWKRRAAAVALVREARRGRSTALILDVGERLRRDPDYLVQKAVGWLLKEAHAKKPREIVRFLRERRADTPRLVLRTAAEKMSARERGAILD